MSLNKMLVIGNLGGDPEMRYTSGGVPVTSFSVATNRRYTTASGEQRDETEWFRVSAWRQLAEQCNQFLSKGRQVYVEGRLNTSTWQAQDGQNRTSLEITADRVVFLSGGGGDQQGGQGGRGDQGGPQGGQGYQSDPPAGPPPPDDAEDLPW
ncbi:MAG: single-stranded DNA-binding protein [SAR202 cluster bacterium]|jgi:single-strand DNA-binding protein|nr:single-stranded DNA-binding protein [SAR202 cluster bacterium]MDP6300465.1 single-stranded DNA-binding protein [SAR202 cluster bacterium]MDP7102112.1 single-stranded DNA-binding protein [SAR202 cluster bacterium]MDP7224097.1 single-stranded DNA-binding protein [SAR202 cluster bacterium]MDP7412333.1 single-stranded DNA-binding protein [SAR202 cluster bacterium]|tara:strand:+ start:134 stop:589 length:456 start_codon:yes stop_codon:yes gene_type:complete